MSNAVKRPTTVACPECDAEVWTVVPRASRVTDHRPDGIVQSVCPGCGATVDVGFRRTDGR